MRRLVGPLAAGVAVAVYCALFRTYGVFDIADEGTLLAQAGRTAAGQAPYIDFHTGYGPLYFALQAWLVRTGGWAAVRWALVATHGATAALLYALARRVAGGALAAVAVALEVAVFLPIAPAAGAPFNVPYPAWYAGLLGLGVAAVLDGSRERPPAMAGFLAGVLSGVALAVKPNSGIVFAAGGAAAIVLARGVEGRAGAVGWAVLAAFVATAITLVGQTGLSAAYGALVPPLVLVAAVGGWRGSADRETLPVLLALGAGFVLVGAALFAGPFAALGSERFLSEAFLVGSGVARIYARPYPWPAVLAAVVGVAGFLAPDRRAALRVVAAGTVVIGVGIVHGALAAAGGAAALRAGGEEAALVLVPLVVAGTATLLRRRRVPELVAPGVLLASGALQLYPRPDFVHLMAVAPLLLPPALGVWRAATGLLPARWRAGGVLVVGLPLALAAVRFVPTAAVLADMAGGALARVPVGETPLVVEPSGAPRLQALAAAVRAVHAATEPRDDVFAFPACALVTFLAGREPAGSHDYFFPGRPTRGEAAVLALRLGLERPPVAVTCRLEGTDLGRAWDYYPELVGLLEARYHPMLERPPFTVYGANPRVRRFFTESLPRR